MCNSLTRRTALLCSGAFGFFASAAWSAAAMPSEVAGVIIPRTGLALKSTSYARANMPEWLFNHCMRTYLFGGVAMKKLNKSYNLEAAFSAAALHDMGLLKAFESAQGSFEIDGANAADALIREQGGPSGEADIVWHAIVFHDTRRAIVQRAGPEATLVATGAAADVDGPDDSIGEEEIVDIVTAFPRLGFKHRFTQLAIDHCKRKPLSQRGTWLEGLCREQAPSAFADTVEKDIASAPFAE